MPGENWNVVIEMDFQGNAWGINLTASEQMILTLVRSSYPAFEKHLKQMAEQTSTKRAGALPAGLIDDLLVLLRCLVFNRLEAHEGKFVQIKAA